MVTPSMDRRVRRKDKSAEVGLDLLKQKNGHTRAKGKLEEVVDRGDDIEEGEVFAMEEGEKSAEELGTKNGGGDSEDEETLEEEEGGKEAKESGEQQDGGGAEGLIDDGPKVLSKSAQKNLAKSERYKEKKKLRKAHEKEARHQETQRKRKVWEEKLATLTEEEKEKAKEEKVNLRNQRKDEQKERKERLREAMNSGQNFVIDLEFAELMKSNELTSLIQQVMYCYAANRRAEHPGRLTLTGVNGAIKTELEKLSGFENWLLHREEKSYIDVYEERKEDLVYLTADSETVLDELDMSKIYIIGGLVDRNRWKNITLDKATKQGIATAKLPIGDHLKMAGSKVLTVNQVMELLLSFMKSKDWKQTLSEVVPLRKRGAESNLDKEPDSD